ncbi:hypothetical protein V501_01074 [Pseudogymnoascus sp. VKM F-4519 (FW-2642)]|nr:hypothetical protein V501_01074 [Pseudogymnoascus sp. VKM F-4519 (FW-2642)]
MSRGDAKPKRKAAPKPGIGKSVKEDTKIQEQHKPFVAEARRADQLAEAVKSSGKSVDPELHAEIEKLIPIEAPFAFSTLQLSNHKYTSEGYEYIAFTFA